MYSRIFILINYGPELRHTVILNTGFKFNHTVRWRNRARQQAVALNISLLKIQHLNVSCKLRRMSITP